MLLHSPFSRAWVMNGFSMSAPVPWAEAWVLPLASTTETESMEKTLLLSWISSIPS